MAGRLGARGRREGRVEKVQASSTESTVTSSKSYPEGMFLEPDQVEAMIKDAGFEKKPEELVGMAKDFLASGFSVPDGGKMLAQSFEFVGPVVGPLTKSEFLRALNSFKVGENFSISERNHDFRVDPFEPNRVWFTTRPLVKHDKNGPLGPATGKIFEAPPQSCSICFNKEGKVTQFTIGYVMDRRIGDTGGLGGIFGLLYAIDKGLPFPEAQPWEMSNQYKLFNFIQGFLSKLQGS